MKTLDAQGLLNHIKDEFPDDHPAPDTLTDIEVVQKINRWLERGDGVAVYQNDDLLSSHLVGRRKFISFGSAQAQLEPQHCICGVCGKKLSWTEATIHHDDESGYDILFGKSTPEHEPEVIPPTVLPDIGDQINYRYTLKGIYRGEAL